MEQILNEVTLKVTYKEYLEYYNQSQEGVKTYKAFGKDWVLLRLEVKGTPSKFPIPEEKVYLEWEDCFPQCFATFKSIQ